MACSIFGLPAHRYCSAKLKCLIFLLGTKCNDFQMSFIDIDTDEYSTNVHMKFVITNIKLNKSVCFSLIYKYEYMCYKSSQLPCQSHWHQY